MSPGWMTLVSQRSFSTPSSRWSAEEVQRYAEGEHENLRHAAQGARAHHIRQVILVGGLYSRSRYLPSSAVVYSHFKTRVFNARLAVNCRRTAASPATSAAVSVHQGSALSPSNEFICAPEIRRVDGSVQQQL